MVGIAGLKSPGIVPKNPSAKLLRDWIEKDTFVWLVSDEILLEYKRVLGRLGVRRPTIGKVINLLREEAEHIPASALPDISPDPGDDPFCACAEIGRTDFIVTLNPKDFRNSFCLPTWSGRAKASPQACARVGRGLSIINFEGRAC